MVDVLACRGPDDQGSFVDGPVALGHRRLAVIDLAGGTQPMTCRLGDASVSLTYSGEVYNFVELRRELTGLGHRFRTSSDTEVVLRGYVEWGPAVVGRLNGMFAFAVWDGRSHRLTLFRDRLGVKPLFYSSAGDAVLFASEPKAILAHPAARRDVGVPGLRNLLCYVLSLPGLPWESIREVRPGTYVAIDPAGITTTVYWTLRSSPHADTIEETVATTRQLLDEAARANSVADVPLGILLSGGLDSSTLAALVSRDVAPPLRTYSMDFLGRTASFRSDFERPTSDGPFIRLMADHLGADHLGVVLDHTEVCDQEVRRRAVASYDSVPGFGDRDRSMYLLFRTIKQTATVALSGESADELFGGYGWFQEPAVQKAEMFPWVTACMDTYGVAPEVLHPDLAEQLDITDQLRERYLTAVSEVEPMESEDATEHGMRVMSYLHLTMMLRVLLDRKDRLSMASGLEVRVPYCDHRLVEYVYNIPWQVKTFDGREKAVLRAAAQDLLPEPVLGRIKSAYPSIQGGRMVTLLQRQLTELARSHDVFQIVDPLWVDRAAAAPPAAVTARVRNNIDWILNLAAWLDVSRPDLRL